MLVKPYLSMKESVDFVFELTGEKINWSTLEELSNVEQLTPVFLFSGYVGCPDGEEIHYDKMKAYFTHNDFFMHQTKNYETYSMFGDADVTEWIEIYSPFIIQNIIKHQSRAYNVSDEVFLFKNLPIGKIDKLDDLKYSRIDFDDVRFSRDELISVFNIKQNKKTAQDELDFYLGAMDKLTERAKSQIKQPSSRSPIEHQRLLIGYSLFTPHHIACLLSNSNPAYEQNNDEYNAYKDLVNNALEAENLNPINDKNQIPAQQVKYWLADFGFVYDNFNDNLPSRLNQPSQQLIDAQHKIADLEQQLAQANEAIVELKRDSVDSDKALYLTPAINIMNKVITEFWINYDPDQPAPKQSTITNWITDNFNGISPALALNIDKVCRHDSAKSGGKYKIR